MTRNKLYLLFTVLISASYVYIIWAIKNAHAHCNVTFCTFKNITGVACPSCGSTRSVLLLTQGKMTEAGLMNPFGYIITLLMIVLPFWLLYDVITKNDSLYKNYKRAEKTLSGRRAAITLITLVCLNWAWNIYKGL
jgi:Protein of unknown function (DUF2752)